MDFAAGQTLLFDKPLGWTSFDVVSKVRRVTGVKKVGHAGTLDPLATGLLIICTGPHTKRIESLQGQEKEYEALLKLGAVTASYDAEQPEESPCDASHIGPAEIEALLPRFRGEIEQLPPLFSAVKVEGKRAYKAARAGEEIALRPRQVHIHALELLDHPLPPAHFALRVQCSKGTYIRSLAHDIGQALGVGAYLRGLIRTRIGSHHLEDAWQVEAFAAQFGKQQPGAALP